MSYVPKTPFSEIAHPLARGRSVAVRDGGLSGWWWCGFGDSEKTEGCSRRLAPIRRSGNFGDFFGRYYSKSSLLEPNDGVWCAQVLCYTSGLCCCGVCKRVGCVAVRRSSAQHCLHRRSGGPKAVEKKIEAGGGLVMEKNDSRLVEWCSERWSSGGLVR